MAAKTQNIAVEYFNPKKNSASGLTATNSDFWVYCLLEDGGMTAYLTDIFSLLNYISNNQPFRVVDVGGDKNASLFMYKKDKILPELFVRIDNLNKDELLYIFDQYINERNKRCLKE